METNNARLNQAAVRPVRVVIGVTAWMLVLGGSSWLFHPIMVKLHGGKSCLTTYSDGKEVVHYGNACNR
jgi:hypothetical protein